MDIAEKRRPQDGRIKTEYNGREVELRVSTMPVSFGEKMVIRVLDASRLFQGIDGLGMTQEQLSAFRRMIAAKHGLILVTGPTGSGKTTTLYSALNVLSSPEINITTIEDPVEMVYEDFNQSGSTSPTPCAPFCAKTPMSSWSAKFATKKRLTWRSKRRSRGTSSFRRSTPTTRHRPLRECSTSTFRRFCSRRASSDALPSA